MQALQFLKGAGPLPVQKEAADLSNRKESSVSSFKTILEDASRTEVPQKEVRRNGGRPDGDVKSTAKDADASFLPKKEKLSEKETVRAECSLPSAQAEVRGQEDAAPLSAVSGEEFLFGRQVEQLPIAPHVAEEASVLEDAAFLEPVFDPRPLDQSQQLLPDGGTASQTAVFQYADGQASEAAAFSPLAAGGERTEFRSELDKASGGVAGLSDAAGPAKDLPAAAVQGEEAAFIQPEAQMSGVADGGRQDGSAASPSRFAIVDNRPSTVADTKEAKPEGKDAKAAALRPDEKLSAAELKADSVKLHGNTLDISFSLNQEQGQLAAAEQNSLSSSGGAAATDASSFQRMLSAQLLSQAPEFVRAGSIILRDNDNGTINLNLKPEALGNVKITLHVSDKGIEGQIVVASKEAFEAFSQNMDNLKQSFRQSGFDAASLSLNLSDGSSFQDGQLAQGRQRPGEEFMAGRTFGGWADGEGKMPSSTIAAAYGAGGHQIDVVA